MRSTGHTPARRMVVLEARMHALMGDLADQERRRDFERCRDALVVVSTTRHALAAIELREARAARDPIAA